MKLTVNKTVSEEIEITLPYFFKSPAHWVAILSEEEGIQITECMGYSLQLVDGITLADRFINSKPETISEHEFYLKYDEVFNNNFLKHLLWNTKKNADPLKVLREDTFTNE